MHAGSGPRPLWHRTLHAKCAPASPCRHAAAACWPRCRASQQPCQPTAGTGSQPCGSCRARPPERLRGRRILCMRQKPLQRGLKAVAPPEQRVAAKRLGEAHLHEAAQRGGIQLGHLHHRPEAGVQKHWAGQAEGALASKGAAVCTRALGTWAGCGPGTNLGRSCMQGHEGIPWVP